MKIEYLIAEIGSTTTVINAFSKNSNSTLDFIGQGQSETTVLQGDVNIGLENAMNDLREKLDVPTIEYENMLATSSAAGGLRMSVHGLVYDMTVRAAKEAVLGAGANIKFVTSGKISRFELKKINEIKPNIILIAGGVDYGERETAIYNAEQIARLKLNIPVIYAGNISCRDEISFIFEENEQHEFLKIADNVYPKIDVLNVEPVRKIIQETFEENIIFAPGMNKIRNLVKGHIMPTPGAVMEATKLIYEKLGDVVTFDVGGATTDVSSITDGSEAINLILQNPEPRGKRTVEGDLGCYVSRKSVIDQVTIEKLASFLNLSNHEAMEKLENLQGIPKSEVDIKIAEFLCKESVKLGMNRHCGEIKLVFDGSKKKIAYGKDLTSIKYVIGTGGALTRLPRGKTILKEIINERNTEKLAPREGSEILIDSEYIMASLGVLSLENKELAIELLMKSLNYKG